MLERDLPQGTADQSSRTFEDSIEDISQILQGPQASEEEDDNVSATDNGDPSGAPDGPGREDGIFADVDGAPPESEEIADADGDQLLTFDELQHLADRVLVVLRAGAEL